MSNDTTLYTVGEVAERFSLTVRTLRHWEAQGLLAPTARSWSNYRLYSREDCVRVQRIVVYRATGMKPSVRSFRSRLPSTTSCLAGTSMTSDSGLTTTHSMLASRSGLPMRLSRLRGVRELTSRIRRGGECTRR